MKQKKQKAGFLSMLLGTLGASLLGNLLAGKGILRAGSGCPLSSTSKNKKGKRNFKSWFRSSFVLYFEKRMGFLIPPHPLINFEIQKYYKNEPRFNGVFSRNNLPKRNKGWGVYNKS